MGSHGGAGLYRPLRPLSRHHYTSHARISCQFMIDYVGLLWFRDTRGAGENAVVAVRDCHCRPPPCHLCNAFTSTNTLAILGVADVGTGVS